MFLNNIHAVTQNTEPNSILLPDGLTYLQTIRNTFSNIYAIYPLNETSGVTAEEIINNYDGTYNGPTLGAIAGPGASMGSAAFYDGLVDYCQLPAASLDGPFDPNLGTMMIWWKMANAGVWTDGLFRYVATLGANSNNRFVLYKTGTNNTLSCRFVTGGVLVDRTITSSTLDWFYLGVTWNKASNRMRLYFNGTQQGADIVYTGTWSGALADAHCLIGNGGGNFGHGYPSFLMLSSAEATAAQMAIGAIAV